MRKSKVSELVPHSNRVCGIYKIENLVNGKVYIGQAVDIYRRMKKHIWDNCKGGNNPLLTDDMNKYGTENFSYELLCECLPDELYKLEQLYIEKYNSYTNGYNLTVGGLGNHGWRMNDDTREQIRTNNTGGKSHFARKTVCEDKVFDTAKECADYYHINYCRIKDWLSGKTSMPKEWYDRGLRYEDTPIDNYKIRKEKFIKVVYKNIEYKSIREFCRLESLNRNKISSLSDEELNKMGIKIIKQNNNCEMELNDN